MLGKIDLWKLSNVDSLMHLETGKSRKAIADGSIYSDK
jgi:hypothetical protein